MRIRNNKLSLLIIVGLSFSLLFVVDVFTYEGFVYKHIHLSKLYVQIIIAFIGAALIYLLRKLPYRQENINKSGKILAISFIIGFFIYTILGILEYSNFTNFVYSRYHVQYLALSYLLAAILYWSLLLVGTSLIKRQPNIFHLLLLIILSVFLLTNVNRSLETLDRTLSFALANPGYSYDEKMERYWGGVYDFVVFVRDSTPENSFVILPDNVAGGFTGNSGMMRYFLYPRKLVTEDSKPYLPGSYLLATPGNELGEGSYRYWPDTDIDVDHVWYFDPTKKKVVMDSNTFEHALIEKDDYYALLKLK